MNVYSITTEELTKYMNAGKEALLLALEKEGLLTDKAETIAGNYAVVIHEKGVLGKTWDKLRGTSSDAIITVVKGAL